MVDQITYHKTQELWWIKLHTIKPRNYGGSDYIHCTIKHRKYGGSNYIHCTIKHRNYDGSDYIPYKVRCPVCSMSLKSLDLTAHSSLSPIRRGFAPSFVNYIKGCTWLAAASDKVYHLLAHCRWFSPCTPASCSTKTGHHDIAESGVKTPKIKSNQILYSICKRGYGWKWTWKTIKHYTSDFDTCDFVT
jgi:hypothetical protein